MSLDIALCYKDNPVLVNTREVKIGIIFILEFVMSADGVPIQNDYTQACHNQNSVNLVKMESRRVLKLHIQDIQSNEVTTQHSSNSKSIDLTTIGRGGQNDVVESSSNQKEQMTEEKEAEKEKREMDALVRSTIIKSSKRKWPKSINKTLKYMVNQALKALSNPFVRELFIEAARPQPPIMRVPRPLVRVDPTRRNIFPPGTYSRYSSKLKMEYRRSSDREATSLRRTPPLKSLFIKNYSKQTSKAGIPQVIKKRYHKKDLVEALNLPNNYFDQFKTSSAEAEEVIRLLQIHHCSSDSLLVRENGILNKREPVIHTLHPKTRLYVGFESPNQESSNDSHLITYYRVSADTLKFLKPQMTDPKWDGNIGLSVEEHKIRKAEIKRNQQNNNEMKRQRELFKEFYATRLPKKARMSNAQRQTIPDLIDKIKNDHPLSTNEIDLLNRFKVNQDNWSEFMLKKSDYSSSMTNLLYSEERSTNPASDLDTIYDFLETIPTLNDIE